MLPVPLSPASSWAVYRNRLSSYCNSLETRVNIAFFSFGLINNVLYVIVLSAALDLVGPTIPKGVVLLADVIPSFIVKLVAPYFIHLVPYSTRVVSFVLLSAVGMLMTALSPDLTSVKLFGVALVSLSSGYGEMNFLGLTHFYGQVSLASWSIGTGAAGLVGAGAYAVATASGLSSRTSLFAFSFLPLIMFLGYFVSLPREKLNNVPPDLNNYERVAGTDVDDNAADETSAQDFPDSQQLLSTSKIDSVLSDLTEKLQKARSLFFPFMLPLFLVYLAEYCINQGVSPTLLFPISSTPFHQYREFYPAYNAIYQIGVFISRSSSLFLRVHNLYVLAILQVAILAFLTSHAMFDFLPSVWIVFLIIFGEGLLGGLVYVNTFAEIIDSVPAEEREFSLEATTVSDSGGIFIAGILSMGFETALCKWQVRHGRDLCLRT